MSSSTLRGLQRLSVLVVAGGLLAGCTSLTEMDEVRINKDPPKSLRPDPEPTPEPAEPAAVEQVRDPAQAAPRKAGTG
jgi:hypothetical protein